jgi:hypothetical protein
MAVAKMTVLKEEPSPKAIYLTFPPPTEIPEPWTKKTYKLKKMDNIDRDTGIGIHEADHDEKSKG